MKIETIAEKIVADLLGGEGNQVTVYRYLCGRFKAIDDLSRDELVDKITKVLQLEMTSEK